MWLRIAAVILSQMFQSPRAVHTAASMTELPYLPLLCRLLHFYRISLQGKDEKLQIGVVLLCKYDPNAGFVCDDLL